MSYTLTYTSGGETIEFGADKPYILKAFSDPNVQNISFATSNGANEIGDKIEAQSVASKTFVLTGTIRGRADRLKEKLLRAVAPMQKGILTYNGKLSIEVYPKLTPTIERYTHNPMFNFTLYAPYPFWRSANESINEIVGFTRMFRFPWNISAPYRFSSYSAASYVNIYNNGTVPARWRAEFYAGVPMSNPKLLNVLTGAFIRVNKEMEIGDKIIIDTTGQELTVTGIGVDGRETSLFEYLDIDSDPFQLVVGDNLVQGTVDVGGNNLQAKLYHFDYYAGVDVQT